MKIKEIHEEEIKDFVQSNYSLNIDKIKYFPLGEDGASYIIWLSKGKSKKYVKVCNKGETAFKSIIEIKTIIEFLYKAREKYNFVHAPLPFKNKNGNLISKFRGFPVIVYDYITGGNIKEFSKRDYIQLGGVIAELHSLNKRKFSGIKKENLDLKWEGKILAIISSLKKSEKHKELSKEILPKEELFVKGINFLRKEVIKMHKKQKEAVIVHADIHKGNLMKEGNFIYLIDWDGLELALPEKDLMWFSEGVKLNAYFKESYKKSIGKTFNIDEDALKFYIIKRIFSEIVFFSRVLFFRELTQKEKEEKLNFIRGAIGRLGGILK